MPSWISILFIIVNALSWLLFLVIYQKVQHVSKSHIRLLGNECENLIQTKRLRLMKFFHAGMLIIFTIVSIIFLSQT